MQSSSLYIHCGFLPRYVSSHRGMKELLHLKNRSSSSLLLRILFFIIRQHSSYLTIIAHFNHRFLPTSSKEKMVVLSGAICTKSGKPLVTRQFVEMTRIRIEVCSAVKCAALNIIADNLPALFSLYINFFS